MASNPTQTPIIISPLNVFNQFNVSRCSDTSSPIYMESNEGKLNYRVDQSEGLCWEVEGGEGEVLDKDFLCVAFSGWAFSQAAVWRKTDKTIPPIVEAIP
jgi:hypothetical protein